MTLKERQSRLAEIQEELLALYEEERSASRDWRTINTLRREKSALIEEYLDQDIRRPFREYARGLAGYPSLLRYEDDLRYRLESFLEKETEHLFKAFAECRKEFKRLYEDTYRGREA